MTWSWESAIPCPRCRRLTADPLAGAFVVCARCGLQWKSDPPNSGSNTGARELTEMRGRSMTTADWADPVPAEIRAHSEATLSDALDSGMCAGADTDAWFPDWSEVGHPSTEKRERERQHAENLCAGCPVIAECLELALRIPHGAYGVWGGTTSWQRRDIRAARRGREAAA